MRNGVERGTGKIPTVRGLHKMCSSLSLFV
nr:MAG TPA: hypothetical protein [Crassvirales sp.]DAS01675.1 MAG TPA: hypothetical protein [Caudoviricetes sp.]